MTGRLAIWFCVLITIVHVARCSNTCCANNESILLSQKCDNSIDEPNPQCIDGEEPVLLCANGEKLSLQCNDGKIIFLDGNVTEDSFTVDDTTNNLVYENVEFDPFRYCINGMINDNKEYHEIAIVCIEDEPSIFLVIVFAALEIITIVFLLFIIVIYLALPELQDLQGKCILHFLINYAVLYLISDTLHRHDSLLCVVKAYSFYFFSICAFCWLCISSFNIWRASITKNMEDSHTYFLYVVYGYGLPAIMLFLMLFIQLIPGNHMKPNFENYNCWFKDYISRWWYYYLPIAILSLAGTYFLVNSSKHLKKNRHSRIYIHRIKALQARCWLYSKLYVVVVLTWICEILHNEFFPSFQPLIFFTDILNCTQGFFIFVILIATRNKVRKILAQRKPCGINCFPNSWITAMDMESEEENRNRYHNAANMEFIEIPLKTMNRGV